MGDRETTSQEIDLLYYVDSIWKAYKKLWWLLLLFMVIGCWVGFFITLRQYSPSYTAKATFTVNISNGSQVSTYYNNTTAVQMARTFPYILTSGALRNRVAEDLGTSVASSISAEATPDSNLFTISVTDRNPETAYQVLQAVVRLYPQVAEYVIGDTQLNILSDSGVPSSPGNPISYKQRAFKYGIAGFLLAAVILVIYTLTQRTIRNTADMKKLTNIANLGSVPYVQFKKRGKEFDNRLLLGNPLVHEQFGEIMRTIRIRVEKELQSTGGKVVMVTSSVPGEGKSMIASNLADSLSHNNKRVILLDCDLHNPTLRKLWKIDEEVQGLHYFLQSEEPVKQTLKKCLKKVEDRNLWILPADVLAEENAADLMVEERMGKCIAALKSAADYIVLDTPPCAMLSDAATLAAYADTAVYVVRHDYALKNAVQEGLSILGTSGLSICGYVLNGVVAGLTGGSYGYNTGYYRKYGYGKYYSKYYGKKADSYGYSAYGGVEEHEK